MSSAVSATTSATSDRTLAVPRSGMMATVFPVRSQGSKGRLPSAHRRQAERIARVEPVAAVEVAGGVADRSAEATLHAREWFDPRAGTLRDAAVGRLQSEQSAESRGDPDRPAPVASRRDRQQPSCHRRCGTAGRTAGRPSRVPRIPRRTVKLRGSAVDAAELASGRLRDQECSCSSQPGDRCLIVLCHPVGEDLGCLGVGPTADILELLHPEWDSTEGKRHIGRLGLEARGLEIGMAEGVERRMSDRIDAGVECLERRDAAAL